MPGASYLGARMEGMVARASLPFLPSISSVAGSRNLEGVGGSSMTCRDKDLLSLP